MFTLESKTFVAGLTGREVFDFLVNPSDDAYQSWWPGVHLALRIVSPAAKDNAGRGNEHVGDVLVMDEYVGKRRLRLLAIVEEAVPGARLVWRLKAGALALPVRLSLDFEDALGCVIITHRIRAGWAGWARVLDPIFRLYLSRSFADAMDAHVRAEFHMLRDRLHPAAAAAAAAAAASA